MMSRLIAVVVHVTMCPSVYHCPFFSSEWNVCLVFTIIRLPSSIFLTNNKKQQQQHQKPLFLENGFQAPLLGATLLYNKKKIYYLIHSNVYMPILDMMKIAKCKKKTIFSTVRCFHHERQDKMACRCLN